MLIPIDSDMDFFTSLQKLSRPFAFFRHGEKRPRFLVMFQPSPSHWVINMVGFFAALLSETGWIISAAQLLSWFANFEQTSLAEVAMSHIRVASVPSTSWTGTVTCWPLNLYIRVYIYDVRYLYQQTGRLKWCYILLYSFNGISWDYTVYWHCLTMVSVPAPSGPSDRAVNFRITRPLWRTPSRCPAFDGPARTCLAASRRSAAWCWNETANKKENDSDHLSTLMNSESKRNHWPWCSHVFTTTGYVLVVYIMIKYDECVLLGIFLGAHVP